MKQSDKEFLCYIICLSWDRLDDSERIRASKIIREVTDKEDDVPKVEYLTPEIISRLTKVPADDITAREDVKKWHQFNDPFVYDPDKEE